MIIESARSIMREFMIGQIGKEVELKNTFTESVMQKQNCCFNTFWLGTHGFNPELGRHRGRDDFTLVVIMTVRM